MFAYLLILASLCNFANGDGVDINVCVKSVPVPQGFKKRPSVPVQNCQDRYMACTEIFKFNNGAVLANNLKPDEDYKVPDDCQKDQYKMLARQICPRTCALCCLTKEYNCQNGKN
uniref:ShKT domain-containing protein n=1 Tax=Dracunculus medinensis TaxID=318479 RepID=A0A0N4URW5_DRAME